MFYYLALRAFWKLRPQLLKHLVVLSALWPAVSSATLVVAVSQSPLTLPFYVAEEQKLFEKHKLNLEIKQCLGGVSCLKMLHAKEADMATCSELPIVFSAFERDDYALITSFVSNKDDMRLIANPGKKKDFKPADLVNKRIGVVKKSSSQYYLDVFLLFNLIDPSQVVQIYLKPEELPQALAEGKVDAISVWEPYGFRAMDAGKGEFIHLKAPKLYTQTFNLVGAKSVLATRQQEVNKLMRVLQDAIQIIHTNPNLAKQILHQRLKLDMAFIDQIFPTFDFELSLRQSLLTTMRGQLKWASDAGYASGPIALPNLLRVIDPYSIGQMDKRLDEISRP